MARPLRSSSKTKLYLATLKTDGLVILDAANGKPWPFKIGAPLSAPTPLRPSSSVTKSLFPLATGVAVHCMNSPARAFERFTKTRISNHMNNSVVLGDYLYGFDGNTHMRGPKQLVCLRWADGAVQWRKDGYLCGSLMAVQNHLLVPGETGNLAWPQPPPRLSTPPPSLGLEGPLLDRPRPCQRPHLRPQRRRRSGVRRRSQVGFPKTGAFHMMPAGPVAQLDRASVS